jgi:hypothetical protein
MRKHTGVVMATTYSRYLGLYCAPISDVRTRYAQR